MSVSGLPPYRLPEHETVQTMAAHKSRGVACENVLLLPGDEHAPVMTQQLFYTVITRTRCRVAICGSEAAIQSTVCRCAQRWSGPKEVSHRASRNFAPYGRRRGFVGRGTLLYKSEGRVYLCLLTADSKL
jgi:hypothetical protein